ncbi:MAG TPA: glycosyltransferase [Deltaproteobacteria bacterium]|nr:glycosyltransferase [Deltaproteobacteria bacterium]
MNNTSTSKKLSANYKNYQAKRVSHWNQIAKKSDEWKDCSKYYRKYLQKILRFVVPPEHRVIEIGCGQGDLLASLKPSYGVGVDFSAKMIARAKNRYPNLRFKHADAHEINLKTDFDFIILSDLVNDLWDVQLVFEKIKALTRPSSRIIITCYSKLWELPLRIIRKFGLAKPTLSQNWLTVEDISGLLYLADFEFIRQWEEIIWPMRTPVLGTLLNRFIAKIWPFRWFALTNVIIARPCPAPVPVLESPKVSVVIPARNEAGNVGRIFATVPEMGSGTELIFVEGHSTDNTYQTIKKAINANPHRQSVLLRQKGKGKGDAVRLGFEHASGDILMILDADLTVSPEDLPRFYDVLTSGKGDFINGVRLVYPMEKKAMRFFNLLGNKFFSLAFSWLLGQPIKDTLCGTKVLWKKDYEKIAENRAYFGDFDPFGDFDLLFGAAKLNLKISEVPIRYRERKYGTTNIQRWKHGWLLLRMVIFAAKKIKFI